MSKEDYALVSNYIKDSLSLPMKVVNRMKPLASMSLLYMKALPCKKQQSHELRLMAPATSPEKRAF